MIPSPAMRKMRAFHGDAKIKRKYLERVLAHEKADEIIHGTYWQDGKEVTKAQWSAAWSAAYKKYADHLIKLLEKAPVKNLK